MKGAELKILGVRHMGIILNCDSSRADMAAPGENLTENRTNRRFKKGAESVEETARTRTTREYKATV